MQVSRIGLGGVFAVQADWPYICLFDVKTEICHSAMTCCYLCNPQCNSALLELSEGWCETSAVVLHLIGTKSAPLVGPSKRVLSVR